MDKIVIKTSMGNLCAVSGGDYDYPGICVYIERPDGVQIDLVAVDVENLSKIAAAYIYEDTEQEDWTKKFVWRAKDIEEA